MRLPSVVSQTLEKLRSRKHVDRLRYFYTFLGHDLPSWPHLLSEEQLARYRSVLVLAPHPDDEAFGMGGTLVLLKRLGVSLRFCWFTNGAHQTRVGEALSFLTALGVSQTAAESFPLADETVVVQEATRRIEEELSGARVDLVCVPSSPRAGPARSCSTRSGTRWCPTSSPIFRR